MTIRSENRAVVCGLGLLSELFAIFKRWLFCCLGMYMMIDCCVQLLLHGVDMKQFMY